MKIEEETMRLLGGSSWKLFGSSLALIMDDVWIVLTSDRQGMAFIDGEEIPVVHLEGTYVASDGYMGQVVFARDDGAVLKLNDGSLWSIPEYDRYDTGWWLPPYPVLVTSNHLYFINLKKGKKIWVNRIE